MNYIDDNINPLTHKESLLMWERERERERWVLIALFRRFVSYSNRVFSVEIEWFTQSEELCSTMVHCDLCDFIDYLATINTVFEQIEQPTSYASGRA